MGRARSWRKTVVVGAGPVGSLAALYAANRGDEVEVFELRSDIRLSSTHTSNLTKSINLALSERGIHALRASGHDDLLQSVLDTTIPMHGRMVHTVTPTGSLTSQSQLYDVHGRFQRSVDRNELNKLILSKLASMPNVKLHFNHKLTGADFKRNTAWFEDLTGQDDHARPREHQIKFDLLIGTDGAHSAVRNHMMKATRMDFAQTYIDCLWSEFTMSADPVLKSSSNPDGFAISPNHLHIWPAGDSMFIALPSMGGTFVCTLFAPSAVFTMLEQGADDEVVRVFDEMFPGVTKLIAPETLVRQWRENPHLPLINIKASPHHTASSVILGDSANAMVPFYGQGMNAGLESVRVLFEHIDRHRQEQQEGVSSATTLEQALQEYSAVRAVDAHAIADLALGNFYEMREGVVRRGYKARKWIEETLDLWMPKLGWRTQYSRVSFGNERYSDVVERSRWQGWVLGLIGNGALYGAVGGVAWAVWRFTAVGRKLGGRFGLRA